MSAPTPHSRPTFVLVTENESVTQRLNESISDEGELLVSDPSSLERIQQIIDAVGAALTIVHLPTGNEAHQFYLIEELRRRKPLLPVLVFAESLDTEIMLSVMRSGACDLITRHNTRDEIRERLQHTVQKSLQYSSANDRQTGKIVALASARPDADSAIFCLHLALSIKQLLPQEKVLLLDLGVPEADTLSFLDLQTSYSFIDAVRSIRRFDETLIETAFAKHQSGLAFLAMAEETAANDITANDVIVLLNILASYFRYVVVNLSGLSKTQFLQLITSHANQIFLLCEQSVPSCRSNKKLIDFLRKDSFVAPVELIIDRYLDKHEPSADEIADRLGIPLCTTLPSSGLARLYMKNSGHSLFEFAPNDPYAKAIKQFAKSLLGVESASKQTNWRSLFTRLRTNR